MVPKIWSYVSDYVAKATSPDYKHIKVFYEVANIVSSEIARSEHLDSESEIKARAGQILEDSAEISPETLEGKLVRKVAQRLAGLLSKIHEKPVYHRVDPDAILHCAEEADRFAKGTEGKANVLAMKSLYDFDHTPFSTSYVNAWLDTANSMASETARLEELAGQDLIKRATELFNDATRVEPETKNGQIIRVSARSVADCFPDGAECLVQKIL